MPRFLLHHQHEPQECPVVFASFRGFTSPLRHGAAKAGCRWGDHDIWWDIEAASPHDALRQLPPYVARRTTATRIGEVEIP
jgi:hypothetical protein